jgi:hypothetical protein
MSRKGQGISINMIIIAAIALLVLVIAAIMISKSGRNVDQNAGSGSCLANGGVCRTTCESSEAPLTDKACPTGQVCCRYNFGG